MERASDQPYDEQFQAIVDHIGEEAVHPTDPPEESRLPLIESQRKFDEKKRPIPPEEEWGTPPTG